MKRIFTVPLLLSLLIQTSCTKDFAEINTDPTRATPANFDPNYFLSNAQNTFKESIAGYQGPILFQAGWVQILASTTTGGANYYSNMDKYVQSSNTMSYTASSWSNCYRAASLAQQIVKDLGSDPAKVNSVSAGIVMKVLALSYAADTYGDLPYSEAFQGETGLNYPKYDKQETAIKAMLSDLDGALSKFDASKAKPSADLYYAGDIAKWKKLGYSLMLRIAMRLTKRDAATAKTYAEKAFAGGVMSSVADDCFLRGDQPNGYTSPNARALITPADYYQVRWSKKLIDFLMASNDPRVSAIAEVPQDGLANNQNPNLTGDNTASKQLGMPNGYDLAGGATDITKAPGWPGSTGSGGDATPIGKYSRPRTAVYTNLSGPVFMLSYAETALLLAEAKARGWNVGSTSAADYYKAGCEAGMKSLATFNAAATISQTDINTYLAAVVFPAAQADQLKMINEQYWATTGALMNFAEAWSNWRRSGHPALTPINYAGNFSNGTIPRRQLYPTSEATANGTNYQAGVSSLQGGDVWTARVWWDN